jgi:hypothetical protein
VVNTTSSIFISVTGFGFLPTDASAMIDVHGLVAGRSIASSSCLG